MSDDRRRTKPQSYVLLALALTPCVFLPATFDVFNIPKELFLIPISVGAFLCLLLRRELVFSKTKVNFLFITLFLGIFVTSVQTETSLSKLLFGGPGRGNGLLYYFAIFLVAFVAANAKLAVDNSFPRRVLFALAVPFLVNVIYGLIQDLGLDPVSWNNLINPIIGTLGNPNFSAALLAAGGIFYLYLFIFQKGFQKWIYFLVFVVSSYLSFQTKSIQGLLIILFGICLMLGLEIYYRSKLLGRILFSGFALLATLVFATFFGLFGDKLTQPTLLLRLKYWQIAIKGIQNNFLIGLGPDSYIEAFNKYRSIEFVKQYSLDLRNDAAHSVILNFGVNFGAINMLLYFLLLFLMAIKAIKLLSSGRITRNTLHAHIISVIWLLLALQSFLSIEQIGLSTIQWILGGFLLNSSLTEPQADRNTNNKALKTTRFASEKPKKMSFFEEFSGELTVFIIVTIFVLLLPIFREESNLAYLRFYKPDSSISNEQLTAETAKYSFYTKQEYARAIHLYNFYTLANKMEKAKAVLEETIISEPQSMEALDQLAKIRGFEGDFRKEIALRERIKMLSPTNANNLYALALAQISNGQSEKGLALATQVAQDFKGMTVAESATALISRN